MCFDIRPRAPADDCFEAMESKLKPQPGIGSKLLQDPPRMQPEEGLTKTAETAAFKLNATVIAGANFLVGNSLNVLQQWASIPTSTMRYLILSVAIAFVSSLVSLRLYPKKAAILFRYVSLVFTTSTSAILWYYLFFTPLISKFVNRNRSSGQSQLFFRELFSRKPLPRN